MLDSPHTQEYMVHLKGEAYNLNWKFDNKAAIPAIVGSISTNGNSLAA